MSQNQPTLQYLATSTVIVVKFQIWHRPLRHPDIHCKACKMQYRIGLQLSVAEQMETTISQTIDINVHIIACTTLRRYSADT